MKEALIIPAPGPDVQPAELQADNHPHIIHCSSLALLQDTELARQIDDARHSQRQIASVVNNLKLREEEFKAAAFYNSAILERVPPFLILDAELRVKSGNHSFYSLFHSSPSQTENRLIHNLGTGEWNIPKLRHLLEEILLRNSFFNDFEITCLFPHVGRRTILLSAQRLGPLQRILLCIEDVTERLHFQISARRSEIRYRRLFEAAKDGILLVSPATGTIQDSNPFITDLLGYSKAELLGKELWQIGILKDEHASREAFRILHAEGAIRYENLPIETKMGAHLEVEFVSHLYSEGNEKIIQCNVRDITGRKHPQSTRLPRKSSEYLSVD